MQFVSGFRNMKVQRNKMGEKLRCMMHWGSSGRLLGNSCPDQMTVELYLGISVISVELVG